jgi:hypothetical protein
MSEVSQILDAISEGDSGAAAQLLPLVYAELRRLAAAQLAGEPPGHTLQPTALVHEAYLRCSLYVILAAFFGKIRVLPHSWCMVVARPSEEPRKTYNVKGSYPTRS